MTGIAYIYVLGDEGGPCKVGWAHDVARRSRTVPVPAGRIEIAYRASIAYKFALYAERYAHWVLREHHFRNEWFNVGTKVAIDAVDKAVPGRRIGTE